MIFVHFLTPQTKNFLIIKYKMQPEVVEFINKMIRLYKKYKMQFNAIGIGMIILMLIQGLIHALVVDGVIFAYISYRTLLTIKVDSEDNTKLINILKLWGSYSTYLIAERVTSQSLTQGRH